MSSQKLKRVTIKHQFRLIDFRSYDEVHTPASESSEEETEETTKKFVKKYKTFSIQMFGINEYGKTCSIVVPDYKPSFFVAVYDDWHMRDVDMFIRHICSQISHYNNENHTYISGSLVSKKKLYGFSAGKYHKFIKLEFSSQNVFNKVKQLWHIRNPKDDTTTLVPMRYANGNKKCILHSFETAIPPILRFFHVINISPSGWITFNSNKVTAITSDHKKTTCDYEFVANMDTISPILNKETMVPYNVCSFDIEASSSNKRFPIPKKTYRILAENIISILQENNISNLSIKSIQSICNRSIKTAFGYDVFPSIDTVYPKAPVAESRIVKLIEKFLNTNIDVLANVKVNDKSVFTIDKWANANKTISGAGDEDNEIELADDVDDADDSADLDEDAEDCEDDMNDMYDMDGMDINEIPDTLEPQSNTICHLLLNPSVENDVKLDKLNEYLTRVFPPLKGDEVTMVGLTFKKYGKTTPYSQVCIVNRPCAPIEGVEIIQTTSERQLLIEFARIIQREQPNIIIGYNVFGFDYTFMNERAHENNCQEEFLNLGKNINKISAKKIEKDGYCVLDKTKNELASGSYELLYPDSDGLLQFDLLPYLRKTFNYSQYTLDSVSGKIVQDVIYHIRYITHPVFGYVTELYSKNLHGIDVHDYIHVEKVGFSENNYCEGGKKYYILGIDKDRVLNENESKTKYNVILVQDHVLEKEYQEIANDEKIELNWCMAKDDVSVDDIFTLTEGNPSEVATVAKYCIKDCNLCHTLFDKIDIMTGFIELSSICSVPISYLILRGQGIKLTSLVAKKCYQIDTLIMDLKKNRYNEGYEGALVLIPKCDAYMNDPVACDDFSSLYPSIMCSENFSHDSKVWKKQYDLNGNLIYEEGEKDKYGNYIYDNLPGYEYIVREYDNFEMRKNPLKPTQKAKKELAGKTVCCWAQFPNNEKGVLPMILAELLKARKDTRAMIKQTDDPFMQNILDKRQNGFKVSANSIYGQTGASTSTFYEKDIAACTTSTGRIMLTYAKRIIEEVYGDLVYNTKCYGPVQCRAEYVYGDTDSVFFKFNLEEVDTGVKIQGDKALQITIEIAKDTANLCTMWLKDPMALAYEKTLFPFFLLSKKRYAGLLYENDHTHYKEVKIMGLSIKRRDSCDYLKDVFGTILNIMIFMQNLQHSIQYLDSSLTDLINGRVPLSKLTITKALRGFYKNPDSIAHAVLAKRIGVRDQGNKPKSGDRMKFVHILTKNKKDLQGEKIETPEFVVNNNLEIDYAYYITNQLVKPIQQFYGICLTRIYVLQQNLSALHIYNKEIATLEYQIKNEEELMKQKEKMRSAKANALIFTKHLVQLANIQNKIKPITNYITTTANKLVLPKKCVINKHKLNEDGTGTTEKIVIDKKPLQQTLLFSKPTDPIKPTKKPIIISRK